MEKKYRQMDGELRLMEDANPLFYRCELWLLNAKDNRNKWRFINLEKHMRKFAGTPVLTAYVKGGEQVGDGHNFRMVPDPETGDMVPTFTDATAERIVGAINEDADDMSMKKDGAGVEWIVGIAKIWKWYARELVAKIKEAAKQGRGLPVSIETLVLESYMDGDVEVETEYEILGTTILGDHVAPAVADARIKALQALAPQFEKLKLRAAAYEEAAKKPQTTEKKGVKQHMSKNLTKQQMNMLAQKLADHTLLHAGEAENGTITVLAASKTGEILTCSVGSVADEINAEMLTPRQLSAAVSEGVEIDVGAVLEKMLSASNAEVKVLSDQLREKEEKLNSTAAELAAANQRISDMETAEKKRRVNAAKAAAEAELECINANRDAAECINAECIKPVLDAADNGEFTDCCDSSGEWNGAEKACAAVRDRAMQEQMKLDKQRLNAKAKKVYAFEPSGANQRNNAAQDDSLEAAYQKMMGEA